VSEPQLEEGPAEKPKPKPRKPSKPAVTEKKKYQLLAAKHGAYNTPEGVRRSSRSKMAPLKFWQGERVVYDRDTDAEVPEVVDVLTCRSPHTNYTPKDVKKKPRKRRNNQKTPKALRMSAKA